MASLAKKTSKMKKILVCGFLRDVIDNKFDYGVIWLIIASYLVDRYSQFIRQNESKLFGDIILQNENKIPDDIFKREIYKKYAIIDVNGDEIFVGDTYNKSKLKITIPFEICQLLYNAPKFFSLFDKKNEFESYWDYTKRLIIKYNDKYLVDKFGGELNKNYKQIRLTFNKRLQKEFLSIDYDNYYKHTFDLNDINYSYKDFDEYYEIRKDVNNMVKIIVNTTSSKLCSIYSANWYSEEIFGEGDIFIGPKQESQAMESKIKEFYSRRDGDYTVMIEAARLSDMKLDRHQNHIK